MPQRRQSLWTIFAISLGAILLLVGIAVVVASWGSPNKDRLAFELRLHIIQFLLVIALGAVVAFLVEHVKSRAEQREQERQYKIETLTSLLGRLDAIYRRVKQTRQRLGLRSGHLAENVSYADEMWKLREEQEDLEQLGKDITVDEKTFPRLDSVRERVEKMDGYLGGYWSRYKDVAKNEDSSQLVRGQLSKFITSPKSGDSDFPEFSVWYHDARRTLVELLGSKRTGV